MILIVFTLALFTAHALQSRPSGLKPGAWLRNIGVGYELDKKMHDGIVQIYFPKGYSPGARSRTILVLHGWRQNPGDWENKTPIAEYADTYGCVLVCPAMRTTLYESRYYPETTNKWAAMPGGEYITKILMPFLRKNFNLASERELTGVFGISTGGRGALLLASKHTELFGAAAGLSGDYDSASLKNDRLLISVYGPYDRYHERWEHEVNVLNLAVNLKNTPVFLGHGGRDSVVPEAQTNMLIDRLNRLNREGGGYTLVYEREKSMNAGHDWKYWASLVPDVMKFFDQRLRK
jgi:S-formylglutathione hydrolase FrmB